MEDLQPDGTVVVSVHPWWSSTPVHRGASGITRQPLGGITIRVSVENPDPWDERAREGLRQEVAGEVLRNETWDQVVPDEAERSVLWRGIEWN